MILSQKWPKINKWSTFESALPRWAIYLRIVLPLCVPIHSLKREMCGWNTTLCLYGSIFIFCSDSMTPRLKSYELGTICTWNRLRELLDVWESSRLINRLRWLKMALFASLIRWFRLLKFLWCLLLTWHTKLTEHT